MAGALAQLAQPSWLHLRSQEGRLHRDQDTQNETLSKIASTTPGGRARLRLLVITESGARTFALPEAGEIVIGRASKCAVRVDDPMISREHARLRVTGAELAIVNLGANGTRVGERRLGPGQ